MKRLLGLLIGAGLAGCSPWLSALTTPPPTLKAELDRVDETITLSAGVALAFSCNSWDGLPCEAAKAQTDDPKVAQVLPAHLNQLTRSYGWEDRGPRAPTGFVIVGIEPGKTMLHVTTSSGNVSFAVVVDRMDQASTPSAPSSTVVVRVE
jgi:hypothetical protein